MTPEELAKRHPRLYHVTQDGGWQGIKRHGLLSTNCLLELFEVAEPERRKIGIERRPKLISLFHPIYGKATINDNVPLLGRALERCLDDGLTPSDWMEILNARVFFWADFKKLQSLLQARLNRDRPLEVLTIDTLSLARAYAKKIDLSPINTGSAIRKAARRGKNTFTPMLKYSYLEWSRLRGGRDTIQEVTVLDGVEDIASHTIDVVKTVGAK
jgi:hypothetical protein